MKGEKVVITLLVGAAFAALAFISKTSTESPVLEKWNKMEFYEGSWEEVLEAAKNQNKPIFIDIYATWCGPCKMMKLHTFSNKEVARFYNENFINLALDGEKGKGAELMERYNLGAFPSLLYLNEKGELITHTKGYHNPKQFTELGKAIRELQ
ncbi:thioredoxin family protein [Fontibacter flavus]|uniref:Thioredoxin family protein n=1 Tax=Fontibacter flavus TaxID=654838 RepID=A0ABV6FV37_9BACT